MRLETTKGAIVIECVRAWAPLGADRFYELVTSGYYDDAAIFRIRPKTWVQFGINGRSAGRANVAAAHDRLTIRSSPRIPMFAEPSSLRGRCPTDGRRRS